MVLSSAASRGLINSPSTSYVSECKAHIASCSAGNRNASNEPAGIGRMKRAVDAIPSADDDVDDDDEYLSQYEIDIVNKYLNELGDADECIESDELNDGSESTDGSDGYRAHVASAGDSSDDESEQRSVLEVVDSDAPSTATAAMTATHAVNASADSDSGSNGASANAGPCTQTSRPSIDPEHANNADVNNNNTSLIGHASNPSDGQQNRGVGQRFSEPNRRTNSSANANMNLPMIVGITSCVWGLCLYAMKSIYSDLT